MAKITTNTGAHVSLTELVKFNDDLIKFSGALNSYFDQTERALAELERGWNDEKLLEYKESFKKYKDLLKPLAEELEISKKFMEDNWIPKIQEYLNKKTR